MNNNNNNKNNNNYNNNRNSLLRLKPISDCENNCNLLKRRSSKAAGSLSSVAGNCGRGSCGIVAGNCGRGSCGILAGNCGGGSLKGNNNIRGNSLIKNNFNITGISFNQGDKLKEKCEKCKEEFYQNEKMVNLNAKLWHEHCFVCCQCFQKFEQGIFFEFEGRKYCKHDFEILFAPFCHKCKQFIIGRVIKAMKKNWHSDCFNCNNCGKLLADLGFVCSYNRPLCKNCYNEEKIKLAGKVLCYKCKQTVDDKDLLKIKTESYHGYHYHCEDCGSELDSTSRIKNERLYCLRCYDKKGIPICAACRRPIEERLIHAIGKTWHVEHFVCCQCEKPFFGGKFYEKNNFAYCETHYFQLFGNTCFYCNKVITGDVLSALNKSFCQNHFYCYTCDKKINNKSKFMDFDLKTVCKDCYKKLPNEFIKRQKKWVT